MENIEVIFEYKGQKISIQCKRDEKMKDISERFANKIVENLNNLDFLYSGGKLNLEQSFNEQSNNEDKQRNSMNIIVNNIININNINNEGKIKSKEIICPRCKEICRMSIINFKIIFYECKNGHKVNNIFLEDFNNTQMINELEIICNNCNENNKYDSYKKQFFKCLTCDKNLCVLCNQRHKEEHKTIDYEQKDYICKKHNEIFFSYCKDCKINLCMNCYSEHEKNHIKIEYLHILPNKEKINEELIELRKKIDKFNQLINNIIEIIEKLNKIKEKMEIFYQINSEILNNYDKNRNYDILKNVNEISNNIKMNNIDEIINDCNNFSNKTTNILNIYDKMFKTENNHDIRIEEPIKIKSISEKTKELTKTDRKRKTVNNITFKKSVNEFNQPNQKIKNEEKKKEVKNKSRKPLYEKRLTLNNDSLLKKGVSKNDIDIEDEILEENEIIIQYKVSKNDKALKLFGKEFVENNKQNCIIKFDEKEMTIREEYLIPKELRNINILKIKLKGENITNMSYMFHSCKSLLSLSNDSKLDTSKVTDMSYMFFDCNNLSSLSCISNWKTSNVTKMNYMFYGCVGLKKLPDISNWDTSKVETMEYMFKDCYYLLSLPDISKWDTSNVTNMSFMFSSCESLNKFPDISEWNISNVTNLSSIFRGCKNIKYFPDISKWDDSKVEFKYNMFADCENLVAIPPKFK